MFSRILATLALGSMLAVGCSRVTSGTTVQRYDAGKDAIVAEATADGDYALYSTFDSTPVVTYSLKKGDQLGFKKAETGKVVAVAGSNEVSIQDKSYIWKKK
ncbi:MAG TPA: hypothetical protein PLD59_08310 [Tepidisphaeraceae bacterium]|nr:hypothetical protein [Tepidisphaeraceae bacterium]